MPRPTNPLPTTGFVNLPPNATTKPCELYNALYADADLKCAAFKGRRPYPHQFRCLESADVPLRSIDGSVMGTGKTTTSILTYYQMYTKARIDRKPRLVCILPLAVLGYWAAEFQDLWPNHPPILMLHGSERTANDRKKNTHPRDNVPDYNIIFTTYETLVAQDTTTNKYLNLLALLREDWAADASLLVIDEIHRIRNAANQGDSVNGAGVVYLSAKFPHVIGMSGTLLMNKLADLVAPMSVLRVLPMANMEWLLNQDIDDTEKKKQLRNVLTHVFTRRSKSSIGMKLPPAYHQVVELFPTEIQDDILERQLAPMEVGLNEQGHIRMCAYPTSVIETMSSCFGAMLVGILDYPTACKHLTPWSEDGAPPCKQIMGDPSATGIQQYMTPLDEELRVPCMENIRVTHHSVEYMFFPPSVAGLLQCSAHARWLMSVLPLFTQRDEQVIIFSERAQALECLRDIIQHLYDVLYVEGRENGTIVSGTPVPVVLIYRGGMRRAKREEAIDLFKRSSAQEVPVLLFTSAGQEGVAMPNANVILLFDIWHHSGRDDQASNRPHRPGQTRPVRIIHVEIARGLLLLMKLRQAEKNKLTDVMPSGEGEVTSPLGQKFSPSVLRLIAHCDLGKCQKNIVRYYENQNNTRNRGIETVYRFKTRPTRSGYFRLLDSTSLIYILRRPSMCPEGLTFAFVVLMLAQGPRGGSSSVGARGRWLGTLLPPIPHDVLHGENISNLLLSLQRRGNTDCTSAIYPNGIGFKLCMTEKEVMTTQISNVDKTVESDNRQRSSKDRAETRIYELVQALYDDMQTYHRNPFDRGIPNEKVKKIPVVRTDKDATARWLKKGKVQCIVSRDKFKLLTTQALQIRTALSKATVKESPRQTMHDEDTPMFDLIRFSSPSQKRIKRRVQVLQSRLLRGIDVFAPPISTSTVTKKRTRSPDINIAKSQKQARIIERAM
jgi:hypothetical protein